MIDKSNSLSRNKIISVSENRRKFEIRNNSLKDINRVQVDGCFIALGLRCDYLFEIEDSEVFYVELKGKHIEDAIKQLVATINHCKNIHKSWNKSSFIVASRVPKVTTSIQNLKKEHKRKYNSKLDVSTTIKIVNL